MLNVSYAFLYFFSEKAAPVEQESSNPDNSSTQPLAIPGMSYSEAVSESPAASLSNSPCQSPMLREEDEQSETGESEGEDEDEGPGPQWAESDSEVTEVDINDVDMNQVCCCQYLPLSFQNPEYSQLSLDINREFKQPRQLRRGQRRL